MFNTITMQSIKSQPAKKFESANFLETEIVLHVVSFFVYLSSIRRYHSSLHHQSVSIFLTFAQNHLSEGKNLTCDLSRAFSQVDSA
jgi:hypothetical protein